MALEFSKKSIVLLVGKYVPPRNNLIFGSDFDNVEFYAVSAWYRKFFDTEKAVPPKNQFLYGKGGTNNKFNFTTVPLVPRLVPHYRFFRRPGLNLTNSTFRLKV